jgi:hypothetical protein
MISRRKTAGIIPILFSAAVNFFVASADVLPATYLVGPGRTYQTLQDVAPLLDPGDTVLVDGDHTYPGDVRFRRAGAPDARIVIRGVRVNGNRPVISGGTDGVHFFTDYPYDGPGADHYTFEGFEVTGAANRGIFHQSKDLILRDVVVHHCMHGILGADQGSGSCLLEYSELYANGSGDRYHQVYMATDEVHNPGSVFRMQFCYLHDGVGGNNVKSRAERNEIYYNWIEGAYYHELELVGPDGGDDGNPRLKREDSDVVGNVFRKSVKPVGDSEYFNVTRIGGDATGESHGRYRFVNNTFLCGSRAVFRMFDSLESVEMHNNIFYRIDGSGVQVMRTVEANWTTGSALIAGRNNWVHNGSTQVPVEWSASVFGDDPGFTNLAALDLRPAAGSPLIDGGVMEPSGSPGFEITSPLHPPVFLPPAHSLLPVGAARGRSTDAQIDIGAIETEPTVGVPPDEPGSGYRLLQNYPNPFNPVTRIGFSIPAGADVRLTIFNSLGEVVAEPLNEYRPAGHYTVEWDGRGEGPSGSGAMPSGVYYYRLIAGPVVETRPMLLIR